MTQASSANWEIAIVLPLGVVENQLRKIEEQLRTLNMKALEFSREQENRSLRQLFVTRMEHIGELLGSITGLVSDINADTQPKEMAVKRVRQSMGKSYPDRDD